MHRLRRVRALVFNDETRRPWTAAVLSAAIFSPLFWLSVAVGLGRLRIDDPETATAFPGTVVVLYFLGVLVVGPVLAHTAGFQLDRFTAGWRRDDAVAAFAGLGLLLGALAVVLLLPTAPGAAAFAPGLWLFGLPVIVASALTRYLVDRVELTKAQVWGSVTAAYAPTVVALLVLLGLFVGQGADVI